MRHPYLYSLRSAVTADPLHCQKATPCRHPNLLANLALLRSVTPLLHSRDGSQEQWLPGKKERVAANPSSAKSLISFRL